MESFTTPLTPHARAPQAVFQADLGLPAQDLAGEVDARLSHHRIVLRARDEGDR
jgi:hypothetical protein